MRAALLSFVTALTVAALPVFAQDDEADALFDAMGLPEIIDIMREEGADYGETIARDMFPSGMTPRWADKIKEVYNLDTMDSDMRGAFATALQDVDLDPMLAFYDSALGRRIVAQEIDARRAMLDPDIEAATKDLAAEAMRDDTVRFQLVTEFILANDLIESNVVGGLNSNYAFVSGLFSGGATVPGLTADTLLADVWAQEADIRISTTEWLYAFLLLAYAPLSDTEVAELTAFTQTPEGRKLTSALFVAFDQMFERVSRDLGVAASGFIISQEL